MSLTREQLLIEYKKCMNSTPYALRTYLQTFDNTVSKYVPLELFQDQVLLIEDLDEYLYHVDRMLMACKNAGLFNNIQALLVGSMIDMNDNAVPFGKTVKEMILDLLGEANFPVVFDVPMGHDKQNYAVKLGAVCNFDNSTLTQ